MNVVLGSAAGSLIGFIVATIIRPPYPFFKFTIVQIGIGKPIQMDPVSNLESWTSSWTPSSLVKELF